MTGSSGRPCDCPGVLQQRRRPRQPGRWWTQDLSIWLPLAAVSALWLWRCDPRGFVVVPSLLAFWTIESVSIVVDQWWGVRLDPQSSVVSASLVGPFAIFAIVGLVPLLVMFRGFDGSRAVVALGPTSDSRDLRPFPQDARRECLSW